MAKVETTKTIDPQKTKELIERIITLARDMEMSHETLSSLAADGKYIRINGEGYKPISLKDEYPLTGYSKNSYKKLSLAKSKFSEDLKKPGLEKNEHWIQANIIREALLNDLKINSLVRYLKEDLDELFFAFDELPFVDKNNRQVGRLDLLCVGMLNGKYFPVIIELKGRSVNICSSTEYEGVIHQLSQYSEYISKDYKESVRELLKVRTDKDVDMSHVMKIAIFKEYEPDSENIRYMKKAFFNNGILALEYPKRGKSLRFTCVKTENIDA